MSKSTARAAAATQLKKSRETMLPNKNALGAFICKAFMNEQPQRIISDKTYDFN